MKIVYSQETVPASFSKSMFLIGPTPRSKDVKSWRPDALLILAELGYDGVVFVPEFRDKRECKFDYVAQVEWELEAIRASDALVCWIPREMTNMPALTTNDEWGTWKNSGKMLFGAPDSAVHVSYQRHYAHKLKIDNHMDLRSLMVDAVQFVSKGALRTEGERFVPQVLWHTDSFQSWYQNQLACGNKLMNANIEMLFRVGKNRNFVFCWVAHVDVYVAAEGRRKSNEIIISRPDIAAVLLYSKKKLDILDTKIVLVKEFRSPVNNESGFVWELPSGSDRKSQEWQKVAQSEVHEETGLDLAPQRFKKHDSRQLAATFSTHKAALFSCELTDEEMNFIKSTEGQMRGNNVTDSEQTYSYVCTLEQILRDEGLHPYVDWSTLGMILSVLQKQA